MGCCGAGALLGYKAPSSITVRSQVGNVGQNPETSVMSLATALASDRVGPDGTTVIEPVRVSLITLIEEETVVDLVVDRKRREKERNDTMCCVCMERKKGAAFIPCGHTLCRLCSREVMLSRGCCPLCNRPIIEILDIY